MGSRTLDPRKFALLTVEEMARADALAMASGISGASLMEAAGRAAADAAFDLLRAKDEGDGCVAVLCGPGNNGGDGYVAARLLRERGVLVQVAEIGRPEARTGDAAAMRALWTGGAHPPPTPSLAAILPDADLIVDALFGAGLNRAPEAEAAAAIRAANASGVPILSLDVPSGVHGSTGQAFDPAIRAARTVTFCRRKPGHLLLPGRALCGEVSLADIGIPEALLDEIAPRTWANAPALWTRRLPVPQLASHKYERGAVVVLSGPAHMTGAARLAARGALRAGAGAVTIASLPEAVPVNAAHLTAIMLLAFSGADDWVLLLRGRRARAVVMGPGAPVGEETRTLVTKTLRLPIALVLDAGAIVSFADGHRPAFYAAIGEPEGPRPVVLTPHEGEFRRLWPDLAGSKLERARQAARASGAHVVLKGADTVIAAPDGRAAINDNAPPWLATAGSGDVLAGILAGLLAQGMDPFAGACAAVWLHGACAARFGPGLIAEDLPEILPWALRDRFAGN